MTFKSLEQFLANGTAIPTQGVIHPDPFAADINPAAPLEVGQVA